MSQTLIYVVQRGEEMGIKLTPHKFSDGSYVASKTRFESDYVRAYSINELIDLKDKGYGIRMSNKDSKKHKSPSLIAARFIEQVSE